MPWTAQMISADQDFEGAPLFRKEFDLDMGHGEVAAGTLRFSALGIGEAWINGQRVSEDLLTPGWSSYEWRLRYAEHDVTALLGETTVLGIQAGNGWYRGRLAWGGGSKLYGEELGVIAELEIRFVDGHVQTVGTDGSWSAGPSATSRNDLYDGQDIDGARLSTAWSVPGSTFADSSGVHELAFDRSRLEPYISPPVRRQSEISPVKIWSSPKGKVLLDFGQNLVGFLRAEVTGGAGSVITLKHAEVLEEGELGTRPLRTAEATDRFILSGKADSFEPTFTFHGFRYVEVEGWPGGEDALRTRGGLTAVVIGSDMRRTGYFRSSHHLLNRLHENAVWSTKGNFVDVPTDCPQRDERLGWTGDIAAYAPSAVYLYDAKDFLRDWLRDLALEQAHNNDIVPVVVPNVLKYLREQPEFMADSTAIWSDAAVWVPWAVWMAYGESQVLVEQFPSMAAHSRRVRSLLSPAGIWDEGFQFGDWLDPSAPPEDPAQAKADRHVIATICAFHTARLVAASAEVLGKDSEVQEFTEMAEYIRRGFHAEYVKDHRIKSDAAAVYALAIAFDLLDDAGRSFAGARLAELVAESGYRIPTGFAGTPFLTDALSATGHIEDAYRLLLQTENPSWLYTVSMGATTIWERWDSMLPDGSINPGEMTSFNHYALGAVVDWMHRVVGGLAPLEPGYRRILVAPRPGGDLSWAETSVITPHGRASVHWSVSDESFSIDVVVPDGTEAVLRLPGAQEDEVVPPGRHTRTVPSPVRAAGALI